MRKKLQAMLLCGCLLAGMAGCAGKTTTGENANSETVNLMDGVELMSLDVSDILPEYPITKFGVPLFQNALKEAKNGENVLVSPMSAWVVLCMTEGGAEGITKQQMQEALAVSDGDYLAYLTDYTMRLPSDRGCKVNMANGIWYNDVSSLHVKDYFLQYNKTFFDAAAYKAPFNDNTLKEINHWVSENTDGMIPGILDTINEEDVVYLVNALSFDAEWQNIYREDSIWDDSFTTEQGVEQLVPMLHSEEGVYLEDENATGFIKYYKNQNYAFVALLPKAGLTVAEYAEGLTADGLNRLLENKIYTSVETTMPKFSTEYCFELNNSLKQMGMEKAFDEDNADFSGMATSDIGNIYISRVLQKTFIAVDEKGTKAGAATAVVMQNKMALIKKKQVILNRPFIYMIIECEHNEPLFMGAQMSIKQ